MFRMEQEKEMEEGKGEGEGIASLCCLSLLINKHANAKLLRQLRLHDANCGNCGVWLVACGMCTVMWQVNEPTTKYISSLSRRLYAKTFTATRLPIYCWLHATCRRQQQAGSAFMRP